MITPGVMHNVLQIMAAAPRSPRSTQDLIPSNADLRSKLAPNPMTFVKSYLDTTIAKYYRQGGQHYFPEIAEILEKAIRRESDLIVFEEGKYYPYVRKLPIDLEDRWKYKGTVPDLEDNLYGHTVFNARSKKIGFEDDIHPGYLIAKAYFDSGTPPSLPNLDTAVEVMLNLRAFEGCLIRITAAKKAADNTNSTLAEALTFYRIEGDLVVPSSKETLDTGIPPIETDFRYSLAEDTAYKPNLTTGVWFTEKAKFQKRFKTSEEDVVLARALIDWCLVNAGLDSFLHKLREFDSETSKSTSKIKASFVAFSADIWNSAGLDGSADKARQRFDELLHNLEVQPVPNNPTIWKVVTLDPVKQVSLILTEGILRMNKVGRDFSFEKLEYMAYNNQKEVTQIWKILLSALKAARETTDIHALRYKDLKACLVQVDLPPKVTTSSYKEFWHNIKVSLINQNVSPPWNNDFLIDFVSTAGKDVWKWWQEPRANLSRYNIVLDYYTELLK
jgi:hypothetical protein